MIQDLPVTVKSFEDLKKKWPDNARDIMCTAINAYKQRVSEFQQRLNLLHQMSSAPPYTATVIMPENMTPQSTSTVLNSVTTNQPYSNNPMLLSLITSTQPETNPGKNSTTINWIYKRKKSEESSVEKGEISLSDNQGVKRQNTNT